LQTFEGQYVAVAASGAVVVQRNEQCSFWKWSLKLELQLSSNLLEGPSAVQKQTSASLEPKVLREPNFWIRRAARLEFSKCEFFVVNLGLSSILARAATSKNFKEYASRQ
jgi:hypothetical protein